MQDNTSALIQMIVENNPTAVFAKLRQIGVIQQLPQRMDFEMYSQLLESKAAMYDKQEAYQIVMESLLIPINSFGPNGQYLMDLQDSIQKHPASLVDAYLKDVIQLEPSNYLPHGNSSDMQVELNNFQKALLAFAFIGFLVFLIGLAKFISKTFSKLFD